MSKLLAAAIAVFAAHPDAENVYVCEDGNVFLEERKSLAENHCRSERLDAPRLVSRAEVEGEDLQELQRKAKAEADAAEQAAKDAAAEAAAAEEQARKEAEAADQAANDCRIVVPTEPGYYADKDGAHWLLNEDGTWSWKKTGANIDRSGNEPMAEFAPFTAIEEPKQVE